MNKYENKVILKGFLGKDPEIRYSPSGVVVIRLSLATSTSWKDQSTQEWKSQTEWHRITVFRKTSDTIEQNLCTGSYICVEGYLKYNTWEDKNGSKHRTANIIGKTVELLDVPKTKITSNDKDVILVM